MIGAAQEAVTGRLRRDAAEAIVDAVLGAMSEPTPYMMERGITGRHETLATANVWKDMIEAVKGGA